VEVLELRVGDCQSEWLDHHPDVYPLSDAPSPYPARAGRRALTARNTQSCAAAGTTSRGSIESVVEREVE
jgi:hypothetical protein